MNKKFTLLLFILTTLCYSSSWAQYFNTGNDPASLKWNQLKGANFRVIYPDYYAPTARQIAGYIDTIQPYITFGLSRKPKRIPVILHPENLHSNGVVTWAPRRAELFTVPPIDNFAVPWFKQLPIHEYRHVVQMSNLDQGITRVGSYLFGEQFIGLCAVLIPKWFYEGDATLAETQMSFFGRALQPEFTIEMRAILHENKRIFSLDKWVSGSFKEYVPDEYKFGYQMVAGAQTRYGADFWDKVVTYTARNPYFVISPVIAYRKYANTNTRGMAKSILAELKTYWNEASNELNSSRFIPIAAPRSYTTYKHPIAVDSNTVLALKSDFDRPSRFVLTNRSSGREQVLKQTGSVSSRPQLVGQTLYWTEYKPSLFWEQKNYSVVKSMRLDTKKTTTHQARQDRFFVTAIHNKQMAMMSYDAQDNSVLVLTDSAFNTLKTVRLGASVNLNGLAWDAQSRQLVFIALDNRGMWLGAIDPETEAIEQLTDPSYVTLKNLTATDGKLYFNSIASGKDEIHTFEMTTRKEYRITSSQYGSVAPSVVDNRAVFTTYTTSGYLLAEQSVTPDSLIPVIPSRMPVNRLNPPRLDWNVPKIDTINIASQGVNLPEKRFRKGPNLLHVHSWMPFSIDVDRLVNERELKMGLGATLISQSLLNDLTVSAGYGWVNRSNTIHGNLAYTALPVKLSARVEYGGGNQTVYTSEDAHYDTDWPGLKKYFELQGTLSVPLNFSSGGWSRVLTPSVTLAHYNSVLYDPEAKTLNDGFEKMVYALSTTHYTTMARKNLRPRWGYQVELSGAVNPFRSNFGHLYSLYLRGWLPGVARNHSLMLRGVAQYQQLDEFNFRQKRLFPRGCDFSYAPRELWAASADYQFPLAYPDGGITNVLYIKRLSLNLFGDYAQYKHPYTSQETQQQRMITKRPYTYGGDLEMDFTVFRSTVDFGVTFSAYKPSDKRDVVFGVGFNFTL